MRVAATLPELSEWTLIMLEKQFFHVKIYITEFRVTNIFAFFHPNSFTEAK